MKFLNSMLCLVLLCALVNCASSADSRLEKAQFNLDKGNYNAVIAEAGNAPFNDPTNVKAARILAGAYFARANFDFLDLATNLTELTGSQDDYFEKIATALPTTGDLTDLHSAITTLRAVTGIDDATLATDNLKDVAYDLGLMEAIEHFARGVYTSAFKTTFSLADFTTDDSDLVQEDLVSFDNHLIASGVAADNDFIKGIRQTFCILKDISGSSGFSLAEYEALVGCQLKSGFDPSVSTTSGIASCAALLPSTQSTTVKDCYDADTAL